MKDYTLKIKHSQSEKRMKQPWPLSETHWQSIMYLFFANRSALHQCVPLFLNDLTSGEQLVFRGLAEVIMPVIGPHL